MTNTLVKDCGKYGRQYSFAKCPEGHDIIIYLGRVEMANPPPLPEELKVKPTGYDVSTGDNGPVIHIYKAFGVVGKVPYKQIEEAAGSYFNVQVYPSNPVDEISV